VGYREADRRSREDVQCPHQGLRFEVPYFNVTILAAPEDSSIPRDETENASVAAVESVSKGQTGFGALPNLMEIVQRKVIENSRLGSVP
jgi:hypothetical protein